MFLSFYTYNIHDYRRKKNVRNGVLTYVPVRLIHLVWLLGFCVRVDLGTAKVHKEFINFSRQIERKRVTFQTRALHTVSKLNYLIEIIINVMMEYSKITYLRQKRKKKRNVAHVVQRKKFSNLHHSVLEPFPINKLWWVLDMLRHIK